MYYKFMSNYLIDCECGGLVHILEQVFKQGNVLIRTQTGTITSTCTFYHTVIVLTDIHVPYTK
jgi:hypothetical protein